MSEPTPDVPVLLIVFNRPDKVRKMVSALRDAGIRHLFVAADGPNLENPGDAEKCADARMAIDGVDWPCHIERLFQDVNLGCKVGPETAITWFFSQVPEGIILEDDCLPTSDFFPYCTELLRRFRHDEEVMMISGRNSLGSWPLQNNESYLFSRTSPTWGWATWRRAWTHYDPAMTTWTSAEARRAVRSRMPAAEFRMASRRFDLVHAGTLDAWDFAWAFAMLQVGGVSAVPGHNMIANIGFDEDATHTQNPRSTDGRVTTSRIDFPLTHPGAISLSDSYDAAFFTHRFPLRRRIMTALPSGVSGRIRATWRLTSSLWSANLGRRVRGESEHAE